MGEVPQARECRAWLEPGELDNGCFSLGATRFGKLHEVLIANTQKVLQDALQVSKSFLAASCCTRVLFGVNQPALHPVLCTLGHLKCYWTPLLKH